MSSVPVKTSLGADELRGRSRTLGQRQRTVLLLVDGRRSLTEVLSLAQQAGALASHFDELLQKGMVELPDAARRPPKSESESATASAAGASSQQSGWPSVAPPGESQLPLDSRGPRSGWPSRNRGVANDAEPAPHPVPPTSGLGEIGDVVPSRYPQDAGGAEPLETARARPAAAAPASPAEPALTSVRQTSERQIKVEAPPILTKAAPGDPAAATTSRSPVEARVAPANPAAVPRPAAEHVAKRAPALANPVQRGARSSTQAALPSLRDELPGSAEAPASGLRRALGAALSAAPSAASIAAPSDKLEHVRSLLLDTLRLDSPVFGARMLLKLREASSRDDLIELVWSIERHLAETRHSRKEMLSLHRARELLGLGNTVVPDE